MKGVRIVSPNEMKDTPTYLIEPNGKILLVSESFATLFGYPKEELENNKWLQDLTAEKAEIIPATNQVQIIKVRCKSRYGNIFNADVEFKKFAPDDRREHGWITGWQNVCDWENINIESGFKMIGNEEKKLEYEEEKAFIDKYMAKYSNETTYNICHDFKKIEIANDKKLFRKLGEKKND